MSNATPAQKISLATALDCEGYIGIIKASPIGRKTPAYTIRVSLAMTKPYYADLLSELYGGNVRVRKGRGNWKDQYSWEVSSRLAVRLLEELHAGLNVKRAQSALCLRLDALRNEVGRAWDVDQPLGQEILSQYETLYQESKRLNARGKVNGGN
jgi:hypothetical protein